MASIKIFGLLLLLMETSTYANEAYLPCVDKSCPTSGASLTKQQIEAQYRNQIEEEVLRRRQSERERAIMERLDAAEKQVIKERASEQVRKALLASANQSCRQEAYNGHLPTNLARYVSTESSEIYILRMDQLYCIDNPLINNCLAKLSKERKLRKFLNDSPYLEKVCVSIDAGFGGYRCKDPDIEKHCNRSLYYAIEKDWFKKGTDLLPFSAISEMDRCKSVFAKRNNADVIAHVDALKKQSENEKVKNETWLRQRREKSGAKNDEFDKVVLDLEIRRLEIDKKYQLCLAEAEYKIDKLDNGEAERIETNK